MEGLGGPLMKLGESGIMKAGIVEITVKLSLSD